MKIHCPVCNMAYAISEEKLTRPVVKAVCKRCNTKMIIDRDSKTVQAVSETESQIPGEATNQESSPELSGNVSSQPPTSEMDTLKSTPSKPPDSVMSMSPAYPKHRDALIIGIMIAILVIVLAGGYFLFGRTETAFRKFTQSPIRHLTSLINGYETYKVCESFLRRNERLFRELGRDIRFSLIKEEIRILKGQKTAKLIIKAKGSADTRNVLFQLKKHRGRWRIFYVGFELPNGNYKELYPKRRS